MKIQASSISRILECPGSAVLTDNLPDEYKYSPFKDAATFGRDVHEIAERALTGDKKTIPAMLKEKGYIKGKDNYDRGLNAATMFKKHVQKYIKVHDKLPGKTQILIEKKYRYEYRGLDCVFKDDAMLVSQKKDIAYIDIFDLKTGNWDYAESAYEQLLFSLHIYIATQFKKPKLEYHCRLHVVQPNYYNEPEKIVTMDITLYHESCDAYFKDLLQSIIDIKYSAGDHCTMCPAIVMCPKMQLSLEFVSKQAAMSGDDLSLIDDKTLETIFILKKNLESFLKATESILEKRLSAGKRFDNVYFKEGRGKRYWKDVKETEKKLKFLGNKMYAPPVLLSPAQMEKLAGKENIVELYEQPTFNKLDIRENPFKEIE
jgi:hypothetical protein